MKICYGRLSVHSTDSRTVQQCHEQMYSEQSRVYYKHSYSATVIFEDFRSGAAVEEEDPYGGQLPLKE